VILNIIPCDHSGDDHAADSRGQHAYHDSRQPLGHQQSEGPRRAGPSTIPTATPSPPIPPHPSGSTEAVRHRRIVPPPMPDTAGTRTDMRRAADAGARDGGHRGRRRCAARYQRVVALGECDVRLRAWASRVRHIGDGATPTPRLCDRPERTRCLIPNEGS
jgi:hypothetical protein